MFKFLVAIFSLVLFATDSFATCDPGYYEESALPTSTQSSSGFYSHDGTRFKWNTSPVNLSPGEWRATWTEGTIRGESSCNTTVSVMFPRPTAPSDSMSNSVSGPFCWCRITGWIPSGGSSQSLYSSWVGGSDFYDESECGSRCAMTCVLEVMNDKPTFYGAVTNPPTKCTACSGKPPATVWTTGCNYVDGCPAGEYIGTTTTTITFPTTNGNSYGYYCHDVSQKKNYTSPVNLSAGQWRVTWNSIGTVVGEASCNGTGGTAGVTTSPSNSMSNSANGQYCWCKVTQWIPNSGSSYDLSAAWVFYTDSLDATFCSRNCASSCGSSVYRTANFRTAVFDAVGPVSVPSCETCPSGGNSSGTGDITSCYIPSTTNFTDSKGTYHFTNACYYQ